MTTLPGTGQIAFTAVNDALGRATLNELSLSDADVRTLTGVAAGQITFADFYGKSFAPASSSSLYTFSNHTFTNATATGVNGPTLAQCQSAYSSTTWASNTSFLNMISQGVQRWTVPVTGTFEITAAGAQGGTRATNAGGTGRVVKGIFTLTMGDILSIVVGQQGVNAGTTGGGGGGGGSYVGLNGSAMIVGGGGGGAGASTVSLPTGGVLSPSGAGGGGAATQTNMGGGGGGFTGNGSRAGTGGFGGNSFTNGSVGGAGVGASSSSGGFGGGGGSSDVTGWSGGGGGGYTGGNGPANYDGGASGGTSFGSVTLTNVGTQTGNGYVTINYLSSTNTEIGIYSTIRYSTSNVPIMQIRRSSDNQIQDVYDESGNGLYTITGGTAYTTWIGASTGFVTIWYDQSINVTKKNATQTTTTNQPTFDLTNKCISLPTNTFFNLPNGTIPIGNGLYTVVLKHGDMNNNAAGILGGGNYGTLNQAFAVRRNINTYRNFWWSNDLDFGAYGVNNTISVKYDGTTRTSYVNTVEQESLVSSAKNTTAVNNTIGVVNSNYMNGQLYSLYIFSIALSNTDRLSVERPIAPNVVFELLYGTSTVPSADTRRTAISATATPPTMVNTGIRGNVVRTNAASSAFLFTTAVFTIPESYTKMTWIFSQLTNQGTGNLLSAHTAGSGQHYWWYANGTQLSGGHTSGGGIVSYVTDPVATPASTWTHFALTYDNATTTMRLYRNGSNVTTTTNAAMAWSGSTLQLGIGSYSGANVFSGYLDNTRIYNKALSQREVESAYTEEAGQVTGVVAGFDFRNRTSYTISGYTLVNDLSGNNRDLAFNTAPTYNTSPYSVTLTATISARSAVTTSIEVSGGYSIELLFRVTSIPAGTTPMIFAYAVGADSNGLQVQLNGTNRVYLWNSSLSLGLFSANAISLNTWYHFVVTSAGIMYLNGSAVSTTGSVGSITTESRTISIGDIARTRSIAGNVAIARLYRTPVSATIVTYLYNTAKGFGAYGLP